MLKTWVVLIMISTTLKLIYVLVPSMLYRIPNIFRYDLDLDWGRKADWTLFESIDSVLLRYFLTILMLWS